MKKPNARHIGLAQRLLAHERRDTEDRALSAVGRVHTKLFDRLSTLVGRNGAHALFARSVKLTSADYPFLKAIDLDPERANEIEEMVVDALANETPERISESAIALSAMMLALLETLIGEALTLKVLISGWPEFAIGNEAAEKEKR